MYESRFFTKRLIIVAACALLLFTGGGVMAASSNCGPVGTWYGAGDSGMTWIDIVTPGQSATTGQTSLEWALLDPTLGGFFPTAVRITNGQGVWEKINKHKYMYTWIAYAFDASGMPVYSGRASGQKSFVDCDHTNIDYVLELWLPDQDMNGDPPFFCATGTATESRMPLVQASCQQ